MKKVNEKIKEEEEIKIKETGKCSLCGNEYTHYGNNPEPLKEFEERCCDRCNMMKVIPARLKGVKGY